MSAISHITRDRWKRLAASVGRSARLVLRAGVDFVLPPWCLCCSQETAEDAIPGATLCQACREQLAPPAGPECAVCAAPVGPYLDTAAGCIHCRDDTFRFSGVIRLGVYRDQLRKAVVQAKTATGEALARSLADLLAKNRAEKFREWTCDVVAPVPHFWTRRFSTRHAASETIAERLAAQLQWPCDRRLLRKIRWTPPQAGSPPSIRRRQQRGAFAARPETRNLRVLLVDDVLTTGATANEAARALLAQGAASVRVAVIARGIGQHD